MFTFYPSLPPELTRDMLSTFIPPKQIYGRYRILGKARRKEAILNLCLQQTKDHLFYQTLIFADPTSAQLFETEEEIKALQNAIKESIASPFSTLEHQLGGKLFLTKLRLPDFSLSDDMIPDILALFDKSPNTLQVLLPYTEISTHEYIMSEVAKKLTNGIDFQNTQAAEDATVLLEDLESFISQLDNTAMYYRYLMPILTGAMNYSRHDEQAIVACRILATLFLQANNRSRLEIISTIITALRSSTSHSLLLEVIKTFSGFLSQTNEDDARSSIISLLLDKLPYRNYYYDAKLAIWEVLATVLIQPNGCSSTLRSKILYVFNDKVRNADETFFFLFAVNALAAFFPRANESERRNLPSKVTLCEIIFSQAEQVLQGNRDRCYTLEALATFLPQITDIQEPLDNFFPKLIGGINDQDANFRCASVKALTVFLPDEKKRPIIQILLVDVLRGNATNANIFYAAWKGLTSLLSQESDPQLLSDMLEQLLPRLRYENAEDRYVAWGALAALSKQVNNDTNSILLDQLMTRLGYREKENVPFNLIEPLISILALIRDPKKGLSMIADINEALKDNPTWLRDLSEPTLIKIASFAFASTEVHDILYDNAGEMTLPADYLAAIGNVRDTIEALNMSAPRIGNR